MQREKRLGSYIVELNRDGEEQKGVEAWIASLNANDEVEFEDISISRRLSRKVNLLELTSETQYILPGLSLT